MRAAYLGVSRGRQRGADSCNHLCVEVAPRLRLDVRAHPHNPILDYTQILPCIAGAIPQQAQPVQHDNQRAALVPNHAEG